MTVLLKKENHCQLTSHMRQEMLVTTLFWSERITLVVVSFANEGLFYGFSSLLYSVFSTENEVSSAFFFFCTHNGCASLEKHNFPFNVLLSFKEITLC